MKSIPLLRDTHLISSYIIPLDSYGEIDGFHTKIEWGAEKCIISHLIQ